ncbi:hypothetical protein Godav_024476 [Gossypium davidsonii]|uniref:Uncharacterized protein n=1 Tax=Gossypium davidsonii TaxID=34287 RepID=A0A7J8TAX2_GOSDV|nr:hypothetical protein [Gossypium davidsonii]
MEENNKDGQLDENKYEKINFSKITKKPSWRRIASIIMMNQEKSDHGTRKKENP